MRDIGHTEANALVASIEEMVLYRPAKNETTGIVTKVDASGAWVRFFGADSDTPCVKATAAVNAGDSVSISIVNHRACVTGNFTSPATDDKKAKAALGNAAQALQAANIAGASAQTAAANAASAKMSAESAKSSAESAHESADYARQEAKDAISSALAALAQLGTVEDVMGTLAWIKDHEVFVPATSYDPTVTYYALEDGKYVEVESPTPEDLASYYVYDHESTMANFLQERLTVTSRGLYITQAQPEQYKPTDPDYYVYEYAGNTAFSQDETYYAQDDAGMELVANPVPENIGDYYTRKCNEGNIRSKKGGYLLLTGDNTEIYSENGHLVARYGKGIELFDDGQRVAWIIEGVLHIERAEIQGDLAMKNWVWIQRDNDNLSFRWREA